MEGQGWKKLHKIRRAGFLFLFLLSYKSCGGNEARVLQLNENMPLCTCRERKKNLRINTINFLSVDFEERWCFRGLPFSILFYITIKWRFLKNVCRWWASQLHIQFNCLIEWFVSNITLYEDYYIKHFNILIENVCKSYKSLE